MAANYFALPQFKVPGNAMVDFSPINNALEGMQQQANLNRQRGDMLEQRDYQRGRDAKQDYRTEIDRFGKEAMAIDMISDPGQRAAAHARLIARHPNRAELTPDYLDPIKGPKLIAAEAGQFRDPMDDKMKAAELQLKYAQANKLSREASEAGAQFGKQGTIIQDRNGNFYSVQFGANGQRKVEPLQTGGPDQSPVPLQPSRGVGEVDTGTGTQIIDKATGLPIRQVQKDVAAREQQEAIGKAQGEGMANWSKAEAGYRQFENKTQLVADTIDRAISRIGPLTTGVGGAIMRNLPASEARALAGDLDTIRANLGFKELETMRQNSPTGAALGAVSDVENRLLQSTQAALDQLMRGEDLAKNLGIVKSNLSQLSRIQADKFAQDRAKFGRQTTQQPVATPPAAGGGLPAGEYVWDGTQLVPKGR